MRRTTTRLRCAIAVSFTLSLVALGCGGDGAADPPPTTQDAGTDAVQDSGQGDSTADAVSDVAQDTVLEAAQDAEQDAAEAGLGDAEADAEGGPVDAGPPVGCIQGDFHAFFGNLHAHTSFSDGAGEPVDAFAHARDVAGLDVMVVTDHLEQLYIPPPLDKVGECLSQADDANDPGVFVTGCGFEYGSGFEGVMSTGHNNVFFSDHLFPAVQLDFHEFFGTLTACPTCVGQFNHPGSEPGQTWSDFAYQPEVDERLNLIEFNGEGDVWVHYFQALDAGWHVSPMFNQDNHSADWGSKNDNRSGLYMPYLSRTGLYDALSNRRTFASRADKNATIHMTTDMDCWMGSILKETGVAKLHVEADDPDAADGFTSIELYGPGAALLHEATCQGSTSCATDYDVITSGPTYVVAKALQDDGGELVSAPIWLEP